ncbi:hypothetical protein, partial [uncultured Megasphaera sp.]|uniref:hypothetical protein n=1 Tax=uncultured Megasphaera sp. TaxID=165188 RepID=UPI0025EF4279
MKIGKPVCTLKSREVFQEGRESQVPHNHRDDSTVYNTMEIVSFNLGRRNSPKTGEVFQNSPMRPVIMRVLEDSVALPNSPQGDGNVCGVRFKIVTFKVALPNSPQGDGNLILCTRYEFSYSMLHYQIPRKGTETPAYDIDEHLKVPLLHYQIPRKGTMMFVVRKSPIVMGCRDRG